MADHLLRFATQNRFLRSHRIQDRSSCGVPIAVFTEVHGLKSLSRTAGNGLTFFLDEKLLPTPRNVTNGDARCPQLDGLLDHPMLHASCLGLTAPTESQAPVPVV